MLATAPAPLPRPAGQADYTAGAMTAMRRVQTLASYGANDAQQAQRVYDAVNTRASYAMDLLANDTNVANDAFAPLIAVDVINVTGTTDKFARRLVEIGEAAADVVAGLQALLAQPQAPAADGIRALTAALQEVKLSGSLALTVDNPSSYDAFKVAQG